MIDAVAHAQTCWADCRRPTQQVPRRSTETCSRTPGRGLPAHGIHWIIAVNGAPHHAVDVAVIGAGIVGCAIAHELARARIDVALVDREADVGFGTSKANSGIIHAGHHSTPDTVKGRLEWAGNRRWARSRATCRSGTARSAI